MTDTFPHGEYRGYQRGCRCHDCRSANTTYNRRRCAERRTLPAVQVPHGSRNGYSNYGCSCDPCREAQMAYQRERRARRR